MRVDFKMSGQQDVLALLRALPEEIASKRGGPVRRAVAKGAKVLREQARANFTANAASPGKTGKNWGTGFTVGHIIMKRKRLLHERGEWYIVTVRGKAHPSGNKSGKRPTRANDIAYYMELGTPKQPAEPFMRPAFASKRGEAVQVFETSLIADIQRITRKLARQARARA